MAETYLNLWVLRLFNYLFLLFPLLFSHNPEKQQPEMEKQEQGNNWSGKSRLDSFKDQSPENYYVLCWFLKILTSKTIYAWSDSALIQYK